MQPPSGISSKSPSAEKVQRRESKVPLIKISSSDKVEKPVIKYSDRTLESSERSMCSRPLLKRSIISVPSLESIVASGTELKIQSLPSVPTTETMSAKFVRSIPAQSSMPMTRSPPSTVNAEPFTVCTPPDTIVKTSAPCKPYIPPPTIETTPSTKLSIGEESRYD